MLRYVSTAAILVAAFAAGPVMAECAYKMQTTQDAVAGDTMQLAQTRSDGRTLREEENRRSGTDTAPAPGTLMPRGDQNNSNTVTPQSGTVGAGQNQGSPPGTSSGSGTAGSPSTTDGNSGTNTATNPGTSGSGTGTGTGTGSGGGSGSGASGSGGSGGGGGSR